MEERLVALLGGIQVFGVVDAFGGIALTYGKPKGGLRRFTLEVDQTEVHLQVEQFQVAPLFLFDGLFLFGLVIIIIAARGQGDANHKGQQAHGQLSIAFHICSFFMV